MDKNKLRQELAKALKNEMSGTGTGASVTAGDGAGVATKYAFGKRDNKGTPSDWKAAPSIPNRKSDAIDYKKIFEGEVKEIDAKNIKEDSSTDEILTYLQAAKQNGTLSPDAQEVFLQWMNTPGASREEIIKVLRKLTGMYLKAQSINEDSGVTILNIKPGRDSGYSRGAIGSYYNVKLSNGKTIEASDEDFLERFKELRTDDKLPFEQLKQALIGKEWNELDESLNEGYARFRNESKTRTKPEQFHSAVKQVKQKVNEINRLFEYMNRLQSELSESEGGLKYKKYTEKSIQQIKESTKSLFFKSTKLK